VARFGQAFFGDGSRFGQQAAARRHHSKHTHTKTMASNTLPSKRDRLFAVCDDMCDGLHDLEASIGIKQNTEAVLRPALAAARAAESAFGDAQVVKKQANATLTTADAAGRVFISNARKRLSKFFGEAYTTEWGAAGFPDNSTAVPTTQEDRFNLVASLKAYFTSHPAHESVDMDATAALADTVFTNISSARNLLAAKIALVCTAKNTRDAAETNLRKRANGLVTELETLLSDDDPRWHNFGLSRPADPEMPEAPTFTTLVPGGAGTLLVDWDDALRADHYRVWIFVVGTDTQFRAVDNPFDSDATLSGLTTGSTVKVRVTSVNDAGESAPGPEAQAVVP
jgi:hypothetical protein